MKPKSLKAQMVIANVFYTLLIIIVAVAYFYTTISRVAQQDREQYSYNNTQSIAITFENQIRNFNEMSHFIIVNRSIQEFLITDLAINTAEYNGIYQQALSTLTFIPFGSSAYFSIGVFTLDGRSITTGNISVPLSSDERMRADQLGGGWFWSTEKGQLSMCRLLRYPQALNRSLGYVKINISADTFRKLFAFPSQTAVSNYVLLSNTGEILLENLSDPMKPLLETLDYNTMKARNKKASSVTIGKSQYQLLPWELYDEKTILISLTPNINSLTLTVTRRVAIFAALAILTMSVFQLFFYNRFIFRPLRKLSRLMEDIENENYRVQFNIRKKDEIATLANRFNEMAHRLHYLYGQVYQANLKRKDAEIRMLQAEINPHFLYNTLNTVYWMINLQKNDQAGTMIQSLSTLFRLSLYPDTDGMVPLSVEIDHVEQYLKIQKMRLADSFSYSLDVQADAETLMSVKLVLQPLVENAILHGIGDRPSGEVMVSIYTEDRYLYCQVYDDGIGADPGKIRALLDAPEDGLCGMALRNVNERIQLKYSDPACGLICQQPADGGTVFTVKQKITYRPKEEPPHDMHPSDC